VKIKTSKPKPAGFQPATIIITVESAAELASIRAFFGGQTMQDVERAITDRSSTPRVKTEPAREFVARMADDLNDACASRGMEHA